MFYFMTIICETHLQTDIHSIAIFVIFIVLKSSQNKLSKLEDFFLDFSVHFVQETVKSGP